MLKAASTGPPAWFAPGLSDSQMVDSAGCVALRHNRAALLRTLERMGFFTGFAALCRCEQIIGLFGHCAKLLDGSARVDREQPLGVFLLTRDALLNGYTRKSLSKCSTALFYRYSGKRFFRVRCALLRREFRKWVGVALFWRHGSPSCPTSLAHAFSAFWRYSSAALLWRHGSPSFLSKLSQAFPDFWRHHSAALFWRQGGPLFPGKLCQTLPEFGRKHSPRRTVSAVRAIDEPRAQCAIESDPAPFRLSPSVASAGLNHFHQRDELLIEKLLNPVMEKRSWLRNREPKVLTQPRCCFLGRLAYIANLIRARVFQGVNDPVHYLKYALGTLYLQGSNA